MGIRHLETFVRTEVPNGYYQVNIENEIRKYYSTANVSNPEAPIIVFDLMSLYRPLTQMDMEGLLCGGRFNYACYVLDQLFTKLTSLGASLTFFYDGPVQDMKKDVWIHRQDEKYYKFLDIIDGVDQGMDVKSLVQRFSKQFPNNTSYPVSMVAKMHGKLIISYTKECDQELAAYANCVQAMAVVSDDTDFMIYKGYWRYWSSKDLNFKTLNTMEYNRLALVRHLRLSFNQMRLLATLGGNDVIQYDEVKHLHFQLGKAQRKFYNLANFVRQQPDNLYQRNKLYHVLRQVFGQTGFNDDLAERFQQSLQFYETNYRVQNPNPYNDPVIAILLDKRMSFVYQIWIGRTVNVTCYFNDLRENDTKPAYPFLVIPIVQRQAGIVLYHQQAVNDCSRYSVMIKLNHDAGHCLQQLDVQFPQHIVPPPMMDLLSDRADVRASLQNIKLQLYCWIASDTLDHQRLLPVPEVLRVTVVTLYYLMEKEVLKLFEADLLLQVAYDVAFETYDFLQIQYPIQLNSRPFRVAFLFQKIYNHFSGAVKLLGLDEEGFRSYPSFDGVIFHNRYVEWSNQQGNLEQIKLWRIYKSLVGK